MVITLPLDLEQQALAKVKEGDFADAGALVAEAVRRYLRDEPLEWLEDEPALVEARRQAAAGISLVEFRRNVSGAYWSVSAPSLWV
jgi:Arc/MetJ-type ribon-helix-helix transcriptional regulator